MAPPPHKAPPLCLTPMAAPCARLPATTGTLNSVCPKEPKDIGARSRDLGVARRIASAVRGRVDQACQQAHRYEGTLRELFRARGREPGGGGVRPARRPRGGGSLQRGGEGAGAASRVGLSSHQSAARPLARSGGTARGRGRAAPRPHPASVHRPAVTQDLSLAAQLVVEATAPRSLGRGRTM
jgi:hypothetical protein